MAISLFRVLELGDSDGGSSLILAPPCDRDRCVSAHYLAELLMDW